MFLSKNAKALLDEGSYAALIELPISQLLDADSLRELNGNRFIHHSQSVTVSSSGPSIARDDVSLSALHDAVVIASGYIFSRETIDRLFEDKKIPCCPITRIPITQDCIIGLPQITHAIAFWKLENCVQAIHCQQQQPLSLSIEVAGYLIRAVIRGNEKPFQSLLSYVFDGKNNDIYARPRGGLRSYCAPNWAVVWGCHNLNSRLELWFPRGSVSDDEINGIIAETMNSLNLPVQEDNLFVSTISMRNIPADAYVDAVDKMPLTSYIIAGECLLAFLKAVTKLRLMQGENDVIDEIDWRDTPSAKRRRLGAMQIGSYAVATPTNNAGSQSTVSRSATSGMFSSATSSTSNSSGSQVSLGSQDWRLSSKR